MFQLFNLQSFRDYLRNTQFSRKIFFIQNHHTWSPDYSNMEAKPDEMYWLNSIRNFHVNERHWSDIGQNLTTFPSGSIGLCRPIDKTPAGIFGANTGAICIEHLGNFDQNKDAMTDIHKQTIVAVNALLCLRFGLTPNKTQVVYHHWYDKAGNRFPEDKVDNNQVGPNEQKTCPGTAFFGSNTVASAETNFYPVITASMQQFGA